ncbi:hypothetical protein PybrP1_010166 [[Pythium] brassicae (nom. inval.)]|nr:hypothetical protein PybrP1_010166 [[Pythium] brassicae (nom. inval.)]
MVERFQVRRLVRNPSACVTEDDSDQDLRNSRFTNDNSSVAHEFDDGNGDESSGNASESPPPTIQRQSTLFPVIRTRDAESSHPPHNDPQRETIHLTRRDLPYAAFVRNSVLLVAFAIYTVSYPLVLAFTAHTSLWAAVAHPAVEIVFLVDFLLMFNTSFVSERGEFVTSRLEIAKKYVRGWFLLDLLSSVPVHLIFHYNSHMGDTGSASGGSMSDPQHPGLTAYENIEFLFRVERLVHVLKVAHFFWFARLDRSGKGVLTWLLYSRYSHLFRIVWIVLFIALVAHYVTFERAIGESITSSPRGGDPAALDPPGSMVVPSPACDELLQLGKGQAFGEMALLMNYQRTANARAITHVELCVLSRADLQRILVKHPEDRKKVVSAMIYDCMVYNEANAVQCPLKTIVQSVYDNGSGSDSERVADDTHATAIPAPTLPMRAAEAASLILSVINPEQDDPTIRGSKHKPTPKRSRLPVQMRTATLSRSHELRQRVWGLGASRIRTKFECSSDVDIRVVSDDSVAGSPPPPPAASAATLT